MAEAKSAAAENGLYAALAKLQAQLPFVGKNKTGKVQGKDGKQGYSYDYADLADVTAAIAPLLGKLGLAFTSKPTVNGGGQFVLAYKLVHVSGEKDEGEYLLPSPERVSPQQLGSFITYARRYSLCAVTGLAPGGDDDDGGAAQDAGTTEDDWRSQPPVQPRQRFAHTDAAHERLVPGQSAEDRANGKKADRIKGKAPDDEWTTEPVTDQKWYAEVEADIKTFTTDDYGEVLRRRVLEKAEAGGCTREDAEKLRTLIRARRQALAVERKAEPEPSDA